MLAALVSVTLASALLLLLWPRRPSGAPPGPTPVPLIGSTAFLGARTRDDLFDVLCSLPTRFGSIVGFYAGSMYNVYITGLATTRATMAQREANGRFAGSAQLALSYGKRCGVIVAERERWERNSPLVRAALDELLRTGELERLISLEATEMVTELAEAHAPVQIKTLFRWRYLRVSWAAITGQRLPVTEAKRLAALFTGEMDALQNPWVNNAVLTKLFPESSGYAAVLRYRDAVRTAFASAVRGGGGAFVAHIRAAQPNPGAWNPETDEDLVMFFFDFMNGGCETTSSFCEWSLVYLLREPELQRRLRREAAALPAKLKFEHRVNAPLLRAFEAEVFRRSSLTPAGVPHRALDECPIGDYRAPAGTTLRYDIMGAHWDPTRWLEPMEFQPDRFLRDDGSFIGSEDVVPYGIGLRRCTGERYAEAYHFIMLGYMLKELAVELPSGAPTPTEKATIGLVRLCMPFEVNFRRAPPPS